MSLKNIPFKSDLLSSVGLRVLDLDNLQSGDIEKYKIPFSIGGDLEKVVYFDQWNISMLKNQWQLWITHYMNVQDYFIIDDRKIIFKKACIKY